MALIGALVVTGACRDESADVTPTTPTDVPADVGSEPAAATPAAPMLDEPDPRAVAPEPPPTGYAVARIGALLFTSSDNEVGFELPPPRLHERRPAGVTVNVVGRKDGRLVIETLAASPTEQHCGWSLEGLADFRLRMYLGEDDLLPVLVDDFAHEFGDGTKVRLHRGVPVPPGSSPVIAGETEVRVPVPSEALGRLYEPRETFPREVRRGELYPLIDHPLTYDGGTVLEEEGLYAHGEGLAHYGVGAKDGDALVTLRNECLEITARTSNARASVPAPPPPHPGLTKIGEGRFLATPFGPAPEPEADEEDVWGELTEAEVGEAFGVGGLGLTGTGLRVDRYDVEAGTTVLWLDGSGAGLVTTRHSFEVPPRDHQGRSCFDVPLTRRGESTVTLCFAAEDVSHYEVTSPPAGGPPAAVKKVSRVRQAKATVLGSLDRDTIRRVVRGHLHEVRYCYNQGLARDAGLKGRVLIKFIIDSKGKVSSSTVKSSTVSDKNVGNCAAKAIKRWVFPKPKGGGLVIVSQPFVLEPT